MATLQNAAFEDRWRGTEEGVRLEAAWALFGVCMGWRKLDFGLIVSLGSRR